MRTGDLGELDESGRLRIVGRVKDMFIVGGFNAYPAEIENALLRHPAVQQAAVIGIPDQRLGEVGMAFVVVSGGISGDDIMEWSRNEMANYKVPRAVEIVDALPLTATGKVLKDELRDRAARGRAATRRDRSRRATGRAERTDSPRRACGWWRWGFGSPPLRPGRCWPTGVPTSSRWSHPTVTRCAAPSAPWASDRTSRTLPSRRTTGASAASSSTCASPRRVNGWRNCCRRRTSSSTNLRPDALDVLGLEPASTIARHPRLVYCSVSGYGLRGEDRNRPAYDIGAFWARSGLSVQLANSDSTPLNARGGIGDHISGLAALAGLLAAVLEQRQTGRGRVVEVSLLRTGDVRARAGTSACRRPSARWRSPSARHANQTPLMNSYRTKDGRWFFFTGLEADRHIDSVLPRAGPGGPSLDDPRFADARALRKNRAEVIAVLDDIVGERTLDEWAERLDAEGVWWAPAQGPADVLADPQLAANDGFLQLPDDADGTTRRSINGPVSFSDLPVDRAAPAPLLGEHTEEVLAELADAAARRRRCRSSLTAGPGQQAPGDDDALDLVGPLADDHQRRVAVEALDRELGGVADAAEYAHGLGAELERGLAGEELGHAGLDVAAQSLRPALGGVAGRAGGPPPGAWPCRPA